MRSTANSKRTVFNFLVASKKKSGMTFTKKDAHQGEAYKQDQLSAAIAVVLSLLLGMAATARAQPMTDIGTLQGDTSSVANGISANGTVIVGASKAADGSSRAFRYDLANGITYLGTLSGNTSSIANGVSADGAVIVGYSSVAGVNSAFRYANGAMLSLSTLGGLNSQATAVSADGTVIVGFSDTTLNGQIHAFRYAGGVMTDLSTLSDSVSKAYGVSGNGGVIVGTRVLSGGGIHAFRYADGTMTDISPLLPYSEARGISADGNVIIGFAVFPLSGQIHAFRYAGGEMTDLNTLGGAYSEARGVSANGDVIVGYSKIVGNAADHAFKVVRGVMTDLGTLVGGTNSKANGVSADGTVIVGESDTTSGKSHAFIYRNFMVDVSNTSATLVASAGQLTGLLNNRYAVLGLALRDECNSVVVRPVCVSVGGRNSRVNGGVSDMATQLQLGFRLGSQLRIGATVDQDISTRTSGNYAVTHSQPLVALYAAYAPSGTPAGLQLKVSVAQGSDSVGITRSLLANTEAGQGKSKLNTKGVQLEAAYGWDLDEGWYGSAFAGVKGTRVSRAAYTETSGADFPVSYQAVQQTSTTAYVGLQEAGILADDLWLNMRIGVEMDIRSHQDSNMGTIKFLGPFSVAAPTAQRTRGFGSISGAYRITPTQQISVGVEYSQQPQKDINGMTILVLRYAAAL